MKAEPQWSNWYHICSGPSRAIRKNENRQNHATIVCRLETTGRAGLWSSEEPQRSLQLLQLTTGRFLDYRARTVTGRIEDTQKRTKLGEQSCKVHWMSLIKTEVKISRTWRHSKLRSTQTEVRKIKDWKQWAGWWPVWLSQELYLHQVV